MDWTDMMSPGIGTDPVASTRRSAQIDASADQMADLSSSPHQPQHGTDTNSYHGAVGVQPNQSVTDGTLSRSRITGLSRASTVRIDCGTRVADDSTTPGHGDIED